MLHDNARKIAKSGGSLCICNCMSFTRQFLLDLIFCQTALPCSGGYHPERGGMLLHDVVGINSKNGATAENQGSDVKYMD